MQREKITIVGLVGLPGAGKTTVAKYLQTKGYKRITLSDFIKIEAKKNRVTKFTREVLQNYGNKMRRQYGPQVLVQLAHKLVQAEGVKKVVIDGIRNLYEAAYLRVENHFTLVGVTANQRIRFKRIVAQSGNDLTSDYKIFLSQEHREESLGAREVGLRVKECLKRVSFRVKNEKDKHSLYQTVNSILLRIQQPKT